MLSLVLPLGSDQEVQSEQLGEEGEDTVEEMKL
jgi:hypothetical protein